MLNQEAAARMASYFTPPPPTEGKVRWLFSLLLPLFSSPVSSYLTLTAVTHDTPPPATGRRGRQTGVRARPVQLASARPPCAFGRRSCALPQLWLSMSSSGDWGRDREREEYPQMKLSPKTPNANTARSPTLRQKLLCTGRSLFVTTPLEGRRKGVARGNDGCGGRARTGACGGTPPTGLAGFHGKAIKV